MTTVNYISPRNTGGSFLWSVGLHLLVAGSVVGVMHITGGVSAPSEEFIDLAYQSFDEPPVPEQVEQRVRKSAEPVAPVKQEMVPDNSPKELQDEKGEVAGTQKAAPQENIGSDSNGTASATPYYKIKPKYPRAALIDGKEGWVKMKIDITETGSVENIAVIDGENRNEFEGEAKRAVALYKYKPFVNASGQPIRVNGHILEVVFKLEEHETSSTN